jgi:hypothetical protein
MSRRLPMKMISIAIVGLAIALSAEAAQAYVVQVLTAGPLTTAASNSDDTSKLGDDIASAVLDVVHHAIGFTPTLVRIQAASIIGTQLYLILLLADADGEALLDGPRTDPTSPSSLDVPDDKTIRAPESPRS